MKRIAVITKNGTLFVEDVNEQTLKKYDGNMDAYIQDNYCIGEPYHWNYINSAQYIPNRDDTEVYEIDFKEIAS